MVPTMVMMTIVSLCHGDNHGDSDEYGLMMITTTMAIMVSYVF